MVQKVKSRQKGWKAAQKGRIEQNRIECRVGQKGVAQLSKMQHSSEDAERLRRVLLSLGGRSVAQKGATWLSIVQYSSEGAAHLRECSIAQQNASLLIECNIALEGQRRSVGYSVTRVQRSSVGCALACAICKAGQGSTASSSFFGLAPMKKSQLRRQSMRKPRRPRLL